MSYFLQLHLMLHAYVVKFDVIDTVEFFLRTKHGLSCFQSIKVAWFILLTIMRYFNTK